MAEIWTQGDVDTLKAAIASGILTVMYDGPPKRLATYQSTEAMLRVLALAQQSVARQAGKSTFVLAGTRKGV